MKLLLFVALLVCTFAQDNPCTPCEDPCGAEGSEIQLDLVGNSGQVKVFRSDDEEHNGKFIKLSLDRVVENDDKGKKVREMKPLSAIDAQWCEPESTGGGDDDEALTAVLEANDGEVDIRVTVNINNAVTKSDCCVREGELCANPDDLDAIDCSVEEIGDNCILSADDDEDPDATDCSGCVATAGPVDDGGDEVECDSERVDLADSAFKWSINVDNWECDGDDTTITFGWNIQHTKAGEDNDGNSLEDCSGCDPCDDVDEITCEFDGGDVTFPTTVATADDDSARVTSIEFDDHGNNFGVSVSVPCSSHIAYDPTLRSGAQHVSVMFAFVFALLAAFLN